MHGNPHPAFANFALVVHACTRSVLDESNVMLGDDISIVGAIS